MGANCDGNCKGSAGKRISQRASWIVGLGYEGCVLSVKVGFSHFPIRVWAKGGSI